MRLILPLILIIGAGLLFFGLTTSLFGEIDIARLDKKQAMEDFAEADKLSRQFDALDQQSRSISEADLAKLKVMLPDSVDTVDLLNKINGISEASRTTLADVKIKIEEPKTARGAQTSQISGLGTVTYNFTISGPYPAFRQFLGNLERSLRLVDVSAISFNSVERDAYQYSVELKTYWLK